MDVKTMNIYLLSVRIWFAELKQDSDGTVETGTANMSRAIVAKTGKIFLFVFQYSRGSVPSGAHPILKKICNSLWAAYIVSVPSSNSDIDNKPSADPADWGLRNFKK